MMCDSTKINRAENIAITVRWLSLSLSNNQDVLLADMIGTWEILIRRVCSCSRALRAQVLTYIA